MAKFVKQNQYQLYFNWLYVHQLFHAHIGTSGAEAKLLWVVPQTGMLGIDAVVSYDNNIYCKESTRDLHGMFTHYVVKCQ